VAKELSARDGAGVVPAHCSFACASDSSALLAPLDCQQGAAVEMDEVAPMSSEVRYLRDFHLPCVCHVKVRYLRMGEGGVN
jgi:hypothetical protein